MPPQPIRIRICLVILACVVATSFAKAANYTACLNTWEENHNDPAQFPLGNLTGLTDKNGNNITDFADARGFTYAACVQSCGATQEAFSWSVFSQQFSSWLLPWLALVSQLPFGAENRLDNLVSVLLTVGSPTLAAFSLAISVLNSNWAFRKFTAVKYPNRRNAALILSSLQQIPLKVTSENGLLSSLIVLSENDQWWDELVDRLDYNYTWSIATATSIAWVAIAFLFTVIDSFTTVGDDLHTNGQGVGSLWLWLLPLVVGWLLVPVCGRARLVTALHHANEIAYVAAPEVEDTAIMEDTKAVYEPISARSISDDRAISVLYRKEAVYRDEGKSAPIFNYARVWGWADTVEEIVEAFEHASKHVKKHVSVSGDPWVLADRWAEIHPSNRVGSLEQVRKYCGEDPYKKVQERRGSGIVNRVMVASTFALALQWGTTLSSILVVFYTPTKGLGCRSGAYILYGALSTIIWAMLLVSSALSHYCANHSYPHSHRSPSSLSSVSIAAWISVFLRRVAVLFASMNSIWIVATCIFQFTNVFDTCYCDSSVLGWGANRAFNIFIVTKDDIPDVYRAWAGSFVLAGGVVAFFLLFVSLMIEPPTDDRR